MNNRQSIRAINDRLAAARFPGFPIRMDAPYVDRVVVGAFDELKGKLIDALGENAGLRNRVKVAEGMLAEERGRVRGQVSTLEGLLDVTKEQVKKAHDETGVYKDRVRRAVAILESEDSFLARAKALARLRGHEGDVVGREPDETGLANRLKAAEGLLADERAKTRDLTASLASLQAHAAEVEGVVESHGELIMQKSANIVAQVREIEELRKERTTQDRNIREAVACFENLEAEHIALKAESEKKAGSYRTVIALHERTVARQEARIAELTRRAEEAMTYVEEFARGISGNVEHILADLPV